MTKLNPLLVSNESSQSLLLSRKLNVIPPPSETTLILESQLDSGMKKTKKSMPVKSAKAAVVHVPLRSLSPKKHNPACGLSMGSLADAKSFDASKMHLPRSSSKRHQITKLRPRCEVPSMKEAITPRKGRGKETVAMNSTDTKNILRGDLMQPHPHPKEEKQISTLSLRIRSVPQKRPSSTEMAGVPSKRPLKESTSLALNTSNDRLKNMNEGTLSQIIFRSTDFKPMKVSTSTISERPSETRELTTKDGCSRTHYVPSRRDPKTQRTSSKPQTDRPAMAPENFVRLNLKNNAGTCRGAKRKAKQGRKGEHNTLEKNMNQYKTRQPAFDPLDDYLDGAFNQGTMNSGDEIPCGSSPLCCGHQRPCKILQVKKASANKGRQFYICSMPRGEQCNFFLWVDDSAAVAKETLLKKSSLSGFLARQVAKYVARFQTLTVPELRVESMKRGLNHAGKKQELIMRLSLFVRDQIAGAMTSGETSCNVVDDENHDDESLSSLELEICDVDHRAFPAKDRSGMVPAATEHKTPVHCFSKAGLDSFPCIQRCLLLTFGLKKFREGQEWAIKRCLSRKRSLLVAPTGFGKSLCYSLPAALLDGVCIVISPLISLIEDQLRQLPPIVTAATLSGEMSTSEMAITIDDVLKGRVRILFVSPERLMTPSFRRLFQQSWSNDECATARRFPPVSLLCVDEAHCMSQWAHNFRPSYLRLRSLLDCIEPRSVLAITATAGPPIVRDICRFLGIENEPTSLSSGVKILNGDRDNIDVVCKFMENDEARLRLIQQLLVNSSRNIKIDLEQPIHDGCLAHENVIVYVWRKRDADLVAEALCTIGVEGGVVVYHAGMDSKARAAAQCAFQRGKARICVATVAFGMGINKLDIDAVVHLNLPTSLEHYLQEIGRAGRDGRPARAIALLTKDELALRHSLAHANLISLSQVKALTRALGDSVEMVQKDMKNSDLNTNPPHVFASLHVASTTATTDLKVETIETLLSLMEWDENNSSMVRFEGRVNDVLTIVLKKTQIDNLAERERVVKCISKCGRAVDLSEYDENKLHFSHKAAINDGFGAFEFSVSRCTNVMGMNAEPRHFYAALRRLQSQGEIEILPDTADGQALQVLVSRPGIAVLKESSLSNLSLSLWKQYSNQILCTAGKIKKIDALLRNVASSENSSAFDGKKSARLIKFQELASLELSLCDDIVEDNKGEVDSYQPSCQELMYDAQSVLQYLACFFNATNKDEQMQRTIQFDQLGYEDYTSLTVAKFLHGIATNRTAEAAKHHPLFGKWRQMNFMLARAQVHRSLGFKEES